MINSAPLELLFLAVAGAFFLAGLGTVLFQRRARSCARHCRPVGWAAWILAAVCFGIAGAVLLLMVLGG